MGRTYDNADHLYELEHRAEHLVRPGFRIREMTLATDQKVPWHYHNNICDTFYVLSGEITLYLQDPKETIVLQPSESYRVVPKRPHLVINRNESSSTVLVLQGVGDYDYVDMVSR